MSIRFSWVVQATLLLVVLIWKCQCYVFHRTHDYLEARALNLADPLSKNFTGDYDTITVDNYLRNYNTGPIDDKLVYLNHDVISAYAGPRPIGYPKVETRVNGTIRAWAMFDFAKDISCQLNTVFDWGELALFSCPIAGTYRVYAVDHHVVNVQMHPPTFSKFGMNPTLSWQTRGEHSQFDLLTIPTSGPGSIPLFQGRNISSSSERLVAIATSRDKVVVSDPVVVKESFFCYYWNYIIEDASRAGYDGTEVVASSGPRSSDGTSYILFKVRIWIAEPTAVGIGETSSFVSTLKISKYSNVLTTRFNGIGLVPCLRKAHSAIEVITDVGFVNEYDADNPMKGTPHWLAYVKVHTDRLITTLSDVSFTIAARQNTGSFHCFVGDTRVFINLRQFDFVPKRRLDKSSVNLMVSRLGNDTKRKIDFQQRFAYGHGVNHIGYKWTKKFQPSTRRTDAVIMTNPCVAQEFAMSVAGSLYVVDGLLKAGISNARKVVLPEFTQPVGGDQRYRDYLRVLDVTFIPTHVVVLMADGSVILHSSSAKLRGLAIVDRAKKFRSGAIVTRRWCSRTSTPKLSAMMVPLFSRSGSIVILQVYPTEGSTRMWITPPAVSCVREGAPFILKTNAKEDVVNETDIHYNEYASVNRSNHKTGLRESKLPLRPVAPKPQLDLESSLAYLLSDGRQIEEGGDPHFPPELLDPASNTVESNLEHFNEAVIYVVEDEMKTLRKVLERNGITQVAPKSPREEMSLVTVEFTAVEKQFLVATKFTSRELLEAVNSGGNSSNSTTNTTTDDSPFQMLITTVTVTNLPFRVKVITDHRTPDEVLDTIIPFPGTILLRKKHYTLPLAESRDILEQTEHQKEQAGETHVDFVPQIFPMSTAIPSYVINFGNVLLYTSLESRYARPLHFYPWHVLEKKRWESESKTVPGYLVDVPQVEFNESSLDYSKPTKKWRTSTHRWEDSFSLYDCVVTEQGIVSVLWRKGRRFTVPQFTTTLYGNIDTQTQLVAIGSAITLEGLREVRPFFRNDNVFQRATPDGEIIYGVYNIKIRSPFSSCHDTAPNTKDHEEACIDQVPMGKPPRVCSRDVKGACIDPAFLFHCGQRYPQVNHDIHIGKPPCLRLNKLKGDKCPKYIDLYEEEFGNRFFPSQYLRRNTLYPFVTACIPAHMPREELRSANILGVSFLSYLHGSLKSVKTRHPEAPSLSHQGDDYREPEEPDICPFSRFEIFHKNFDFAEVGYQTRITGQISYIGSGIPTEADLIVEYERGVGIVIDISSSVKEERGFTTILKTIDIRFEMTDFTLSQLLEEDVTATAYQDFADLRAREVSTVFSITIRPTIVNMRCKNTDFFKTVQFNVGCNAFSNIRLLAEATPLKRINWNEVLGEKGDYKWRRTANTLHIPRDHIHRKQVQNGVFKCSNVTGLCEIPYYNLFKNDIFTISYRDAFVPQFEQFLTVTSRRIRANTVVYDLLGSKDYNLSKSLLEAGCYGTGKFWYDKLLNSTKTIGTETSEHENIYKYYQDCFSFEGERALPPELDDNYYHMHNLSNKNAIQFPRRRNQIYIFRGVVVNTYFNRFTYCKLLDTFFMVRITGIPIPRQGLALWHYILVILLVTGCFTLAYLFFYKFVLWKHSLYEEDTTEYRITRPGPQARDSLASGRNSEVNTGSREYQREELEEIGQRGAQQRPSTTSQNRKSMPIAVWSLTGQANPNIKRKVN